MSGVYIDVSKLRAVQAALGASESQFQAAYNRAVKRTAAKLERISRATMISGTGTKGKQRVKGRVRAFVTKNGKAPKPGGGKIWFGLDSLPVSSLKGKFKAQGRRKPRRGNNGQFIKAKGGRGATFIPASEHLGATSFPDSFVGRIKGKRSIWIRDSAGFIKEARMPIFEAMISQIDVDVFSVAGETLLDYFSKDLRDRVAGGIV